MVGKHVFDGRPDALLTHSELAARARIGLTNPILGMIILAVMVIVAVYYIVAAVSAIVGGVVSLSLTKLFGRRDITYADTYPAAFAGFGFYLFLSLAMRFLFGPPQEPPADASWSEMALAIAQMQAFPIFGCAGVISRQLGTPYAGVIGY